MTRRDLLTEVEKTFQQGLDLISSKNEDYATELDALANFKCAEEIGIQSKDVIFIRILEKMSRLTNLHGKGIKHESIEDSIVDIINLLAILKAAYEEDKITG